MHEFSGGDIDALVALGNLCADLVGRITSSAAPVPVLPGGGGSAAKLDAAHLPYVQALLRNVMDAARLVECGSGSDDGSSEGSDGASCLASESDDASSGGSGGGARAVCDVAVFSLGHGEEAF